MPEQLSEGRTEQGNPLCQKTARVGWKGNPTPHPNLRRQLGETEGKGGSRQRRLNWGPKKESLRWQSVEQTQEAGELQPRPLSTRVVQVDMGAGCPALPMCRRQDNASQEPMF